MSRSAARSCALVCSAVLGFILFQSVFLARSVQENRTGEMIVFWAALLGTIVFWTLALKRSPPAARVSTTVAETGHSPAPRLFSEEEVLQFHQDAAAAGTTPYEGKVQPPPAEPPRKWLPPVTPRKR